MTEKSKTSRMSLVAAALAAVLALGTGISSASWSPPERSAGAGSGLASEVGPARDQDLDETCKLVDANGVPLYDSQFIERTGSVPCAEA